MTKELRQLEEQSKSIEESLTLFNEQDFKPVHIGKAMEQALTLANSLLSFLSKKSINTFDDQELVHAVRVAEKDFQNKKEEYEMALQKLSEYGQIMEESKRIQKEHQQILNDIRDAENIIAGRESRTLALHTEYKNLVDKMKNWQELIDEIQNKHTINSNTYKMHFEKNDQILKSIPYGQENPRKSVMTLSEEIKNKMSIFDSVLNDLISSGKELSIETISSSIQDSLNKK